MTARRGGPARLPDRRRRPRRPHRGDLPGALPSPHRGRRWRQQPRALDPEKPQLPGVSVRRRRARAAAQAARRRPRPTARRSPRAGSSKLRARRRRSSRATRRTARAGAARYVMLATGIVDTMPRRCRELEDAIAARRRAPVRGLRRLRSQRRPHRGVSRRSTSDPARRVPAHVFAPRGCGAFRAAASPAGTAPRSRAQAHVAVLPVAQSPAVRRRRCCVVQARGRQRAALRHRLSGARRRRAVATGRRTGRGGRRQRRTRSSTRGSRPASTGLYAIGDVVSALNQISVAVGHAAIAATAIHNRLPRNFREDADDAP